MSPALVGRAARAGAVDSSRRALVVIELCGGNDALNTVIPINDVNYRIARPTLAVPRQGALMLDKDTALHPAMRAMHELFKRGQLAIVQGVGYPNPSRSHFRSQEIWHRGTPNPAASTGWLGRSVERMMGQIRRSCVPVLHIGGQPAEMFRSAKAAGITVCTNEAGKAEVRPMYFDGLGDLAGPRQSVSPERIAEMTGVDVVRGAAAVESALKRPRAGGVAYPQNRLAKGLSVFAQMIVGNSGTRLLHITHGGYDTHAMQAETHAQLLGELSSAVGALLADLRGEGRDRDVLVMIFSEFGRRVRENGSAGTDHGAAGSMFFAGGAVKGGVYGACPSLTDLQDGDLKHTTDFRDCYATVLENWMNVDAGRVLGGHGGRVAVV